MPNDNVVFPAPTLRQDSGAVDYPATDWLTEFCYLLLRDGVPAGRLEEIIREVEHGMRQREWRPQDAPHAAHDVLTPYTNGWLARYARYLAGRLRSECFIELLTPKQLSLKAQRRLRHGVEAWLDPNADVARLGDAATAMQSLDDLGSPEANQKAMEVLDGLMRRFDEARGRDTGD